MDLTTSMFGHCTTTVAPSETASSLASVRGGGVLDRPACLAVVGEVTCSVRAWLASRATAACCGANNSRSTVAIAGSSWPRAHVGRPAPKAPVGVHNSCSGTHVHSGLRPVGARTNGQRLADTSTAICAMHGSRASVSASVPSWTSRNIDRRHFAPPPLAITRSVLGSRARPARTLRVRRPFGAKLKALPRHRRLTPPRGKPRRRPAPGHNASAKRQRGQPKPAPP